MEDKSFEPNCVRCPIVFLLPENELAWEIFNEINSEFIVNAGFQRNIIESYQDEMGEMSGIEIRLLFRKLTIIYDIRKEYHKNTNQGDK